MKRAAVVVLLAASLLLTGCSSNPDPASPALAKSTVPVHSAPAFLTIAQTTADHLGSTLAGVKSDSTRYQGTLHGRKIYLGVNEGGSVEIIYGRGAGWTSGGSIGNTVLEFELPNGDWIQYVPQGTTSKTLAGWVPLSEYMLVKES
jgi:hypothetical protein